MWFALLRDGLGDHRPPVPALHHVLVVAQLVHQRVEEPAHRRDVEFYRFTRTLDSYRLILNDRTTLVLSGSSGLLKLLTEGVSDIPTTRSPPPPGTPTTSTADPEDNR